MSLVLLHSQRQGIIRKKAGNLHGGQIPIINFNIETVRDLLTG